MRVFVCPRCQGDAVASKLASCVGAFLATEHFRTWPGVSKLAGAVVELCTEASEAVVCGCGGLGHVEAASLLVPEQGFAELLLNSSSLSRALEGGRVTEALGPEALPLLWRAKSSGLGEQHWVVDALRAYAAEEEPRYRLALLEARVAALRRGTAAQRLKAARAQMALAEALQERPEAAGRSSRH